MTDGLAGVSSALVAPPAPRAQRTATPTVDRATWMAFLCLALLGYALLGKGFAYLGVPPVFVGEAVLFCGVVSFLFYGKWRGLFDVPAARFLLVLMAWGIVRIVPDFSQYGANALRDAAVWGYSVFAFMLFGYIVARPSRLGILLRWYDVFVPIFLVGSPITWLAYRIAGDSIAHWPWADVPIVIPKGGDAMVHMSGILAFWVAGLGTAAGFVRLSLLAFSVVLLGTFDRAGFLSFLAAFTLCIFLKPRDLSIKRLVALIACGLMIIAAADVRFRTWDREREVSFPQLLENLKSVVGVSRAGDLDDTKQWRLEWWGDIYDYTILGKYFWTGKGFGINLADDDGYQVEADGTLRNPHNGHLTMLARGGVPGFVLWLLVQLSWAYCVLTSYVQSRRAGEARWSGLFLFLLAYWLAFMVNTSFDVFIEGPVAGIWFWTIYGVGLAAVWLHKNTPWVFDGSAIRADGASIGGIPVGTFGHDGRGPTGRILMHPGPDCGPRESDMKQNAYITTSWDDGHPLDLRVAELLAKYSLPGTFYVPMTAEHGTMTEAQIRELSSAFEIGAHTLHHVDLTGATERHARREIVDSKAWIEDSTGLPCPMFCPPKGRYSGRHLDLIRQAGYCGVRTVELLSLAFPRPTAGLLLLPTTVQAQPHGLSVYARNVIKRAAFRNLWLYVAHGRSTDWPTLVRSLLGHVLKHGGVFHLWGHSWELQENEQWRRLEEVLRFMSQFSGLAAGLTNLQVCQQTQLRNGATNENVGNVGMDCGPLLKSDAYLIRGSLQ